MNGARVLDANPYLDMARDDPAHLIVMALKAQPDAAAVAALEAAIVGRETVRVAGRQLYIAYPGGIGTSKLTNAVIERRLGVRGTARNWNTAKKIAALLDD